MMVGEKKKYIRFCEWMKEVSEISVEELSERLCIGGTQRVWHQHKGVSEWRGSRSSEADDWLQSCNSDGFDLHRGEPVVLGRRLRPDD